MWHLTQLGVLAASTAPRDLAAFSSGDGENGAETKGSLTEFTDKSLGALYWEPTR